MNKKFSTMERLANSFVMVTIALPILLLIVASPSMATITNEGMKQLTTEPWNPKASSAGQYAFSWSPDSTKIAYLSLERINNLVLGVMNADGTGKIKFDEFSTEGGGDREDGFFIGFDFDWSPDSKSIVYTKYEPIIQHTIEDDIDFSSIWRMNIETAEKKELAQRAMCPSLSQNGKQIGYIFKETPIANRDVWIMDVDGSNKRKLASNAGYDALLPSWSPDGAKIVYMCIGENKWRTFENVSIWVINADGTNNMQLASDAVFPKWSHDGTKIAYQSVDDKSDKPELWKGSVWIVNPDGTGEKRLITGSNALGFMFSKWSPDGTKITSVVGNEMVVLDADGSGKYWTIPNNGFGSWSPDGKRIVYASGGNITVINADGTQEKKLLSKANIDVSPFWGLLWSPDGTKITYTAREAEDEYGWVTNYNCSVWVMTVGEAPSISPTSTPTVTPNHEEESPSSKEKGIPGLEVVFAIAGLLIVAYLRRRGKT